MADVQLEKGYTKLANEILESIVKFRFNGTQFRLVMVIWRYTYGFQRKQHDLSLGFISEATGIDKTRVKKEMKKLIDCNVVEVIQEATFTKTRIVAFNKNYDQWKVEYSGSIDTQEIKATTGGKKDPTRGDGKDHSTGGEKNHSTGGEKDPQEIKDKDISKETSKERDDLMDKLNPITEYEKFFGGFPTAILRDEFNYWIDQGQFQEPEAIICEAIRRAAKEKPRNPSTYIPTILKNNHNLGLFTLEAVQKYNSKFDEGRHSKNKSKELSWKEMTKRPDELFKNEKPLSEEERRIAKELEEEMPY